MSGTLIIAETANGELAPISLELVAAGRQLADAGAGPVAAFLAGDESHAQTLIQHGADTVYVDTNDELKTGLAEAYVPAVKAAIEDSGATIVLMGQTSLGRDLGPALAFALRTAVAMDCVALSYEGGRLKATRSAYGGNARADVSWKAGIQVATVKPKTFDPLEPDAGRSGQVKQLDVAGKNRVTVLSVEKAEATGVRLEDAAIVIAGGRGLGDGSNFAMLEELASLLKQAAVGASRAACDLGWYPPSQQVGLTGKTVTPDLYIAIGISGASQHMAGMSGSKNIVAINKDPEANMVQVSKFAIIEDYKKVLPALIEEIKKLT